MKVIERLKAEKPTLSFEVFPPKTSDTYESVERAVTEIAALHPDFMSVTYGAGGGTSEYTAALAARVSALGVPSIAHLTCVSSDRDGIRRQLAAFRENGIENILALRGDLPADADRTRLSYRYAYELADEIRSFGDFCIGGACYPECHPESENARRDIEYLKVKVEHGCQFLTTQMFFDNDIFYNFMYRLLRADISVPVVAGIMPVTNARSIRRICSISGNTLPQKFLRIVDRFGDDPAAMQEAGIAFATEQIIDLYANGVRAVHVYSMNKPEAAKAIKNNLRSILK